jgi:Protein of unknown function (DUF3592)
MRPSEWKEVEATVFTCGWQNKSGIGAAGLKVDGHYLITFSYEVDGHWYSGEFLNASPLVEGSKFPLRYDPENPNRNEKSLEVQRSRWFSVAILALLAIGWLIYKWMAH